MIQDIEKLHTLNYNNQLCFAYLTCERLYPNYVYFSGGFHFGNPKILRKSIDFICQCILEKHKSLDVIQTFIDDIEKNIPAPENFSTVLASSAMDACHSIIETLLFLIDKDINRLNDISTFATDTVDMYINVHENLQSSSPDFEQIILNHQLMQNELMIQKGIISYLETITQIDEKDIVTLINLQTTHGSLNL